ncbi:MAG TPA: DNA polymerase III subunit gamma/tau [Pseudomonadales bacterium]|nr:DNA polymerase III subunit gamma/tau [Pseudomonadales bacterium]
MSYQVLARKWRPRNFEQTVGQQSVLRALAHALDHDRLHHAYLFTGSRGVGKTSIARILAKCLNCEQGVSSTPCDQCASCVAINEGRFIDLIEVDAASRTKVEDTRELLENVQYTPSLGRFKIYLIDEVHMLSGHSFNALLKTLEEPPAHVKFLFATTDPKKLPLTVLSRCLQLHLKDIPPALIAEHLHRVLDLEGIAHDDGSLKMLGRAANGSLRDALSLTDQAIAFGGGQLNEADVRQMLGHVDQQSVLQLLQAVVGGNAVQLLDEVEQLAGHGPDYRLVLDELIGLLHQLTLAQVAPGTLHGHWWDGEAVTALAAQMAAEELQLYYQIALHGRRDLPLAPEPRSGFEMVLLRMLAFRPDDGTPDSAAEKKKPLIEPQRSATALLDVPGSPAPSSRPIAPAAIAPAPPPPPAAVTPPASQPEATALGEQWIGLCGKLDLSGMSANLAAHAELVAQTAQSWRLRIDPAHSALLDGPHVGRIGEALSRHLGQSVKVEFELGPIQGETPLRSRERQQREARERAIARLEADPKVKALLARFEGSSLDHESIEVG